MYSEVFVFVFIAVIAIIVSYLIKYFSSFEEHEHLPIENPEVVKPTISKYKKVTKLKTKK
jgi:hypothetical protein